MGNINVAGCHLCPSVLSCGYQGRFRHLLSCGLGDPRDSAAYLCRLLLLLTAQHWTHSRSAFLIGPYASGVLAGLPAFARASLLLRHSFLLSLHLAHFCLVSLPQERSPLSLSDRPGPCTMCSHCTPHCLQRICHRAWELPVTLFLFPVSLYVCEGNLGVLSCGPCAFPAPGIAAGTKVFGLLKIVTEWMLEQWGSSGGSF